MGYKTFPTIDVGGFMSRDNVWLVTAVVGGRSTRIGDLATKSEAVSFAQDWVDYNSDLDIEYVTVTKVAHIITAE